MSRKCFGIALFFLSILHVSYNREIQWKKGLPYEVANFQEADAIQKSTSYGDISERREAIYRAATCENEGMDRCLKKNRTCEDIGDGAYKCGQCIAGFVEPFSDEKYVPVTCENEGYHECHKMHRACLDNWSLGGYKCIHCENYYNEIEGICVLDFCALEPCQNGGTCLNEENVYKCDCPKEYSGKFCETKENNPSPIDPAE